MSVLEYATALVLLVGGIALFLLGTELSSEGLQQSTGPKMKAWLAHVTSSRLKGAGLATFVSTLIHNGPTSIIVLGFVDAGIISFVKSMPMIFGSNIGTTISMQIVAFDVGKACFGILALGLVLDRFAKRDWMRALGRVLIGFGLIFLGLDTMKVAMVPLRDTPIVTQALALYESGSALGFVAAIFAGAILTAVFQSSGVVISILFSLAALGAIKDFTASVPFILGAHIGSCSMTIIACSGRSSAAWRTTWAQVAFNVIGAVLATIMLPLYQYVVPLLSSDPTRQVANFNTLKQVVTLFILLPFVPAIGKLVIHMTKSRLGSLEPEPSHLDPNLLDRPEAAILASTKELQRQARIVDRMLRQSLDGLVSLDLNQFRPISVEERAVDLIKYEVQGYVARIGQRNLSARQALMLQRLILASNAIERIGDHIEDIGHLCREKVQNDVWFEDAHMERLLHMSRLVCDMHETAMRALDPTDPDSHELGAAVLKQRIEFKRQSKALKQLVDASMHGCNVSNGLFFLRFLTVIDKIVSHLKAVARQESREDYSIEDAQMLQIEQLAPKPAGRPANHPLHATFEDALRDLPPP